MPVPGSVRAVAGNSWTVSSFSYSISESSVAFVRHPQTVFNAGTLVLLIGPAAVRPRGCAVYLGAGVPRGAITTADWLEPNELDGGY